MKRVNNLYYNICNLDNIRNIYDNVIVKNTKNKKKIINFDSYYIQNIMYVQKILSEFKYDTGRYHIFLILKPKIRIIMSQNIFDKLVNHLVSYYILKPVIEPCLINQNVATRENKGTNLGIILFKKYFNEIKYKYKNFYILKFDISKYFYNIDHEILFNMIKRKIKDKNALDILKNIIDSTDKKNVNDEIIYLINNLKLNIKDKNILKQLDNIPLYKKGKGLPIGNMTSQILGIFYINDLDHFIKEELNIKYYIRYMDDGVIFHYDKKYLKYCLEKIDSFLNLKLKLKLNSKTKIYKGNEAIEFLGFKFFIKNTKLITKVNTGTKKRYKISVKNKNSNSIGSYKGHFNYGNCKNLMYEFG